jgi:GT2 family glycosyltransferase/2-polyprenyl-3-methyl-5-hydroxy-6-metoxy-1,4-benzoquinol methylase
VNAHDLSVVIPTLHRWEILARTLAALDGQTVDGFEVIVVVDGEGDGEAIPPSFTDRAHVRFVTQPHGGPASARNTGVALSTRDLILLLGDDMVPAPDLVARHLDAHTRHADEHAAVLGHVRWHPDLKPNRIHRWLDWSGTQFDFDLIDPSSDAGFGRFFSCNVSLRRALYDAVGGFDVDFAYYYEDLDMGWRLAQHGMRLHYEPDAVVSHLHDYDWAALERRFEGIVIGERMMQRKHAWFEPWFRARMADAAAAPPRSALWPRVADVITDGVAQTTPGARRIRRAIRRRANTRMYQKLAPRYLWKWEGYEGLDELREYLGDTFDEERLVHHSHHVEAEEALAKDEATFYRTTDTYLYDLTAFALWDTKVPYFEALRAAIPRGARVLDYGCGIGTDGLRLIDHGYDVAFADFDNPSTRYLKWRLERRGLSADVYDVDHFVPAGFDAVYSFDVVEHVDDPFGFLAQLEQRGSVVAVNFLEQNPDDVHMHRPLPIDALLDHCAAKGIVRYRKYHGRSHLVIYRSTRAPRAFATARSTVERRFGAHPAAARLRRQ